IKQAAAAAAAARLALQPIPKSQGLNAGNSTLQPSATHTRVWQRQVHLAKTISTCNANAFVPGKSLLGDSCQFMVSVVLAVDTGTHDANEGIQEQIGPEDAATR
ncbi:hypothetical protein CMEL01_05001, partial [Colletotrichum melonis]